MHSAKKEAFIFFTYILIKQKHIFQWICSQVSGIIPQAIKHVAKKIRKMALLVTEIKKIPVNFLAISFATKVCLYRRTMSNLMSTFCHQY